MIWHDWATSLSLFTFMHWRRKWQPTPVFLPGESQGREAWWAAIYGVAQSWTRLKQHSSRSRIAGSYGSTIFTFLRNFHTVSQVAASFCIPTNSVQMFFFLQILSNTYCLFFLIRAILIGIRWYCGFALIISDLECFFIHVGHFYVFLWIGTGLYRSFVPKLQDRRHSLNLF